MTLQPDTPSNNTMNQGFNARLGLDDAFVILHSGLRITLNYYNEFLKHSLSKGLEIPDKLSSNLSRGAGLS